MRIRLPLASLINYRLCLCAFVFVASCSKNQQPQNFHSQKEKIDVLINRAVSQSLITIVDGQANPIAQAQVTIGDQKFTTNVAGEIPLPTNWKDLQDITIQKKGVVQTVYLQQTPVGHVFEAHLVKPTTPFVVKGTVTGFGDLQDDGNVKFALNTSSLSGRELLDFDIARVVSPQLDVISEMGYKIYIPSNVSLPAQPVSYGIFSLDIEKPIYNLFSDAPGTLHVQSNRAQFNFKKVLGELRAGKSFFEVVNDFEFLSVGQQDVQIAGQETNLDIDASQKPLSQKLPFNVTNPVPTSLLFGISLFKDTDHFVVGDVKLRDPSIAQTLAVPADSTNNSILLVLTDKDTSVTPSQKLSNNFSTALVDAAHSSSAALLDRVSAPQVAGQNLEMQKPNLKGQVHEYATYVTLSHVEKTTQGKYTLERKTPVLEIYANNWIDHVDFSKMNVAPQSGMRWDVSFFGIDSAKTRSSNAINVSFLNSQLNQATHAVHNAVDVQ